MNIPRLPIFLAAAIGAALLAAGLVMLSAQRRSTAGVPAGSESAPLPAASRTPAPPGPYADSAEIARKIIDRMNSKALQDAPPMVYVGESPATEDGRNGAININGKAMGRRLTIAELIATAYGTSRSRLRLAQSVRLPAGRFDYLVTADGSPKEALQQALREKFGLTARLTAREEEVYVLRARAGEFDHRRPSEDEGGGTRVNQSEDGLNLQNASMAAVVRTLEQFLPLPIIDETGLRGRFDISLTMEPPPEDGQVQGQGQGQGRRTERERPAPDLIRKAAAEQLGLELQPEKRELEVLLVEAR